MRNLMKVDVIDVVHYVKKMNDSDRMSLILLKMEGKLWMVEHSVQPVWEVHSNLRNLIEMSWNICAYRYTC